MNSLLKASIVNPSIRKPDDDGDTRVEAVLRMQNDSENTVDLFLSKLLVFNGHGDLIATNSDDREEPLSPGDSLDLEVDSGYLKAALFSRSDVAKIGIDVAACCSTFTELPQIALGAAVAGLYGMNAATEIGAGVILESVAVSIGTPDEDGDVRVELRALVRNTTEQFIPRLSFKARAIASNGRELDDSSTEDQIKPSEVRPVELSFYSLKSNRLPGLSIACSTTLYSLIQRTNLEAEVSTTS